MSQFTYKVRDDTGRVVEGEIEADSSALVQRRLVELGYTPISITEQKKSALKAEITLPSFGSGVKLKDVAVFSRQFASMINGGLSLMRSLGVLADQTENPRLASVIREVSDDVEGGQSLSVALGQHPKVFNRLFVSMIRAGETGGVLDSVLEQLADTIEKQVALRAKVKSALTYPVAILALVILVLIGMLIFVVPIFAGMYDQMGGTLPTPTRVLVSLSDLVKSYVVVLIVLAGGAGYGFKRWTGTEQGRVAWDKAKLKMPIFGGLIHKTAVTRFARTLESLLRAGVPILEALDITRETVGNAKMEEAVADIHQRVRGGEEMNAAMRDNPIFPPMVTQMVAVGEESGSIDNMLDKVALFYEREVEATVDSLTSLLEPLLIMVLGGSIGGMVVALYMPMFNLINLVE